MIDLSQGVINTTLRRSLNGLLLPTGNQCDLCVLLRCLRVDTAICGGGDARVWSFC
jgi:hypothetical protein